MTEYKGMTRTIHEVMARTKIQAVPRKRDDERTELKNVARPDDDRRGEIPYRQQEIQKKIIDEAKRGGLNTYKSPDPKTATNQIEFAKKVLGRSSKSSYKDDPQDPASKGRARALLKRYNIDETKIGQAPNPDSVKKPKKLEIEDIGTQPPTQVKINPELDNSPNIMSSTEVKGKLVEGEWKHPAVDPKTKKSFDAANKLKSHQKSHDFQGGHDTPDPRARRDAEALAKHVSGIKSFGGFKVTGSLTDKDIAHGADILARLRKLKESRDQYNNVSIQYQTKAGNWITARKTSDSSSDIMLAMRNVQKTYSSSRVRAIGSKGNILDFQPIDPSEIDIGEDSINEARSIVWKGKRYGSLPGFDKAVKKQHPGADVTYTNTHMVVRQQGQKAKAYRVHHGEIDTHIHSDWNLHEETSRDAIRQRQRSIPQGPDRTGTSNRAMREKIAKARYARINRSLRDKDLDESLAKEKVNSVIDGIVSEILHYGNSGSKRPRDARGRQEKLAQQRALAQQKQQQQAPVQQEAHSYHSAEQARQTHDQREKWFRSQGNTRKAGRERQAAQAATRVMNKKQAKPIPPRPGGGTWAHDAKPLWKKGKPGTISELSAPVYGKYIRHSSDAISRAKSAKTKERSLEHAGKKKWKKAKPVIKARLERRQKGLRLATKLLVKKASQVTEAKDPRHTGMEVEDPKFGQSIQKVAAHAKWNAGAVHTYKHADGSKTRVNQRLGNRLFDVINGAPNRHRADLIQKIHSSADGLKHVVKHGWHGLKEGVATAHWPMINITREIIKKTDDIHTKRKASMVDKMNAAARKEARNQKKINTAAQDTLAWISNRGKAVKEENLDELSKKTYAEYIPPAAASLGTTSHKMATTRHDAHTEWQRLVNTMINRKRGIRRAAEALKESGSRSKGGKLLAPKRRSPAAQSLATPKFRKRVVRDKTKYRRKAKHKERV